MHARAAALAYKTVFLTSAPLPRVLDELFVRLLADIDNASAAIQRRDLAAKGANAGHAIAILTELIAALDPRASPDLATNLSRIYTYAIEKVTAGNIALDVRPLAEARAVLIPVHEAFRTAIREAA